MSRRHVTHRTVIHAWMCDHFGHLNVRFYGNIFDDASFALWSMCEVSPATFKAAGVHMVVARTETDFLQELLPGRVVAVRSWFERLGTKSVTYRQELVDQDTETVHARQRAVEVFFDPQTRASREIPPSIRALLEAQLA